jgi:hypothetical protein
MTARGQERRAAPTPLFAGRDVLTTPRRIRVPGLILERFEAPGRRSCRSRLGYLCRQAEPHLRYGSAVSPAMPDAVEEGTILRRRKRRKMSAAARKAISDAQKARWAKQRPRRKSRCPDCQQQMLWRDAERQDDEVLGGEAEDGAVGYSTHLTAKQHRPIARTPSRSCWIAGSGVPTQTVETNQPRVPTRTNAGPREAR